MAKTEVEDPQQETLENALLLETLKALVPVFENRGYHHQRRGELGRDLLTNVMRLITILEK